MIYAEWSKVWAVDKGKMFDMPRVRAGFVSAVLSNTEYAITHDDGKVVMYMAEDIFLSCREANAYQKEILGRRMNFLRPRLNQMEHMLIQMTA